MGLEPSVAVACQICGSASAIARNMKQVTVSSAFQPPEKQKHDNEAKKRQECMGLGNGRLGQAGSA